eukprot:TRINITY_DN16833_c0_g1_i1.p2 TRINITY_DN16833_c0_g1~~TRINITY_DN16833_c0_g1_i1.p2  ORF type:complete len:243 (+),score=79.20 TRINITY_DN16833_c0_g1_i1:248-976(+)
MANMAPSSMEAEAQGVESAKCAMESVQEMLRVNSDCSEADEDAMEARLADICQTVALDGPVEASLEADLSDMEELLLQLRAEPSDEAEVTVRFGLFEKYMETVEKTRGQTLGFWDECKGDFHEGGVVEVEQQLKAMDGEDNLAVDFVEGRWFVYDMTKKAGANNGMIGRVLANIKTKLELLADQPECPICLEALDTQEEPPAVLGCCHKVCAECWAHWQEMQGEQAFCPLCRHDEFLGNFMQ